MHKSNIILYSVLNWGLGHATRSVPIIDYLIKQDKTVIIAGNGQSLDFLKKRFPDLLFVNIASPILKYGKNKSINLKFCFHAIMMLLNIIKERYQTRKIIKEYNIDTIISDNRPGVFNKKLLNIYITHQINILRPHNSDFKISKRLSFIHNYFIKQYDFCCIPDIEGTSNFSGILSYSNNKHNIEYINVLSRFTLSHEGLCCKFNYDILCIISGIEPQRTIFENILIDKLKGNKKSVLILRGLPDNKTKQSDIDNIHFVNHCNDFEFEKYIKEIPFIICRSGYSTIMDLISLNKKAILIPTPGQIEQEYLAKRMSEQFDFTTYSQKDFIDSQINYDSSNNHFEYKYEKTHLINFFSQFN